MAYKINTTNEHIVVPDGIAKIRDIQRAIMQRKTPEFYELEPAEVLATYIYEEDLPLILGTDQPNWSMYGYIEARMCISSVDGEGDGILVMKPLEANIKEYPQPGEYIIAVNYFNEWYYTQKINVLNQVNQNVNPGASKGWDQRIVDTYKDTLLDIKQGTVRQLKAFEGDLTIQGRFGNTIRFGDANTLREESSEETYPYINIRAGQGLFEPTNQFKPVMEDINEDASTILLTTDQDVDLVEASYSPQKREQKIKTWAGKQVIINSDRIIFNSKGTDIFMFSERFVDVSANRGICIQTPVDAGKVWLGDLSAIEPVLGGDQTMKLFKVLLDSIASFCNQCTGASGGGNLGWPVMIPVLNAASAELLTAVTKLGKRLEEPKSKHVFVANIKGVQ